MADTIQLKRGTAARWLEVNPILAQGEPGVETDTLRQKIGDGVHTWEELSYTDAHIKPDWNAEEAEPSGILNKPVGIVTASSTNTLTNKFLKKRYFEHDDNSATLSINLDNYDEYLITAQTIDLTINNPTGTIDNGDRFIVILSGGASYNITWDSEYYSVNGLTLPASKDAGDIRITFERFGILWGMVDIIKTDDGFAYQSELPNLSNVLNKEQKVYHGIKTVPATPTFSGTTITIPSTAWSNYIDGDYNAISSTKTIDLSTLGEWSGTKANNYGQWFVWMNTDLTIGASKTVWDILDTTKVAIVTCYLIDAGGINYEAIFSREWHSYKQNLLEHKSQHDSWGAQYVSGFTGITIGSGAANNSTNTFSLVGGTIRDEDLYSVITNPQTQCRIGYRPSAGAAMTFDAAGTAYAKLSAGTPYYDNNGTLATLGLGNYGIYWIYATNRIATPVVSIMGQGTYGSVANAQAASQPTLTGFSVAEWKLLYRVIIRNLGGNLAWIQSDPMYNLSLGVAVSAGAISTISAGNVSVVPVGNIASTNAQDALAELDSEKVPTTRTLTINGTTYDLSTDRSWTITGGASGVSASFDGMGAICTVGSQAILLIKSSFTASKWSISAKGTSPTATFDVWKIASGTALPTISNTIINTGAGGVKPALSSGNVIESTNVSNWTTTFTEGDILIFNLDACANATYLHIEIH